MGMMSMDNFATPFMPFHPKYDDSDGEMDDEDFEFDDEDGAYELDDDYDEGDMLDVKPPLGVNEEDESGILEGISHILGVLISVL